MKKQLLIFAGCSLLLVGCGEPAKKSFTNIIFNDETITYDGLEHTLTATGIPDFATYSYTSAGPFVDEGTYPINLKVTADGYYDYSKTATLYIVPKEFTNVTFNSQTVTYDGYGHQLTVEGDVPTGTTITYTPSAPIFNCGTYEITAKLQANHYKTKEMKANLTILEKEFVGLTFESKSYEYDGKSHTLEVKGAPKGATIVIDSEGETSFTDVGSYNFTARVSAPNYKTATLTASLTITSRKVEGMVFNSKVFEYDGNPHSIQVAGVIPEGATISYTSDKPGISNTATNPGVYHITATVKRKNYDDLVLHAILTISTTDDERFIRFSGDTIFFQNAKDDDKLYGIYRDGDVTKVSNSKAIDIIATSNNEITYVDKSIVFSGLHSANYSGGKFKETNIFLKTGARYVQTDGTYYYYAVNGLTEESSGIYKLDIRDEKNPIETRLCSGKGYFLQLVGNYIYFGFGGSKELSRINTTSVDQTPIKIKFDGKEEKIKNLSYINGCFYYTHNELLGDYIVKLTVNGNIFTKVKLTSNAGVDFCVIGNTLYYINVDRLTTSIFGDGIYKVGVNGGNSIRVIPASEYGICSLTSHNNKLYYYDCDGYKLIEYSLNDGSKTDLLQNFVKPESIPLYKEGAQVNIRNGIVYYLDMYDGKTLHSYDPVTKCNLRLTDGKVSNFAFVNDTLYLNLVSRGILNDTYRVNTTLGGAPQLVNKLDSTNIVSDGEHIYYIKENGVGVATEIQKANLDGSGAETIYPYGASNLKYINGKLYFIDGDKIYSFNIADSTISEVKPGGKSANTSVFDSDGTYLYFRQMGLVKKTLNRCKLDGSEQITLVEGYDPINIILDSGKVFFYSSTVSHGAQLCYINAYATEKVTPTIIIDNFQANKFDVDGENIYFTSEGTTTLTGDLHTYYVKITGGTPERIA